MQINVHDLAHSKGVPTAAREAMLLMQERITHQDAVIAGLVEALERIGSLADRCGILPDTDGLRRAYRDIDVMSRVALAKAKESRDD